MRAAWIGLCFSLSGAAWAQQYVISAIAGGTPPITLGQATTVSVGGVAGVATDAAGDVFFISPDREAVFELSPGGTVKRVAGITKPGYSGDGGLATSARLNLTESILAGVALDSAGNLYVTDSGNHRIRRISPNGIITTVAGDGIAGFSGDGGPAENAHLHYPESIAVDGAGNLFIADLVNNVVRKVSSGGIITTVAGNGTSGYSGDGGPATSATLALPQGVAVDSQGNLFIADSYNFSIRKVSPTGTITTFAGTGTRGFSADGGAAASSTLDLPLRVTVDSSGDLFIVDGERVRKVSTSGIITTVAGTSGEAPYGDGGAATSTKLAPYDVALDQTGKLYIATSGAVRVVSANGIIGTAAGTGAEGSGRFSGDGGPAANAELSAPMGLALDTAGDLFIADTMNSRVRKVSPSGIITTVAGSGSSCPDATACQGDGGPATSAQLYFPFAVATDGGGNLFISGGWTVRKVDSHGTITTVAGGSGMETGDGGAAINAAVNPVGLAVDSSGGLLIADGANNRIRRVSPGGIISTVAGNGKFGFTGDGGPATASDIPEPLAVAADAAGDIFIADPAPGFGCDPVIDLTENRIRMVSPQGILGSAAGGGNGGPGDGGPATSATLYGPQGVAWDNSGNLYIADGSSIRKVSAGGIISTIAGGGSVLPQDGALSANTALNWVVAVAADGSGNVYAADTVTNTVYALRPMLQSVLISAVVDGASQTASPVSPGKIVTIYGAGLGPVQPTADSNSGTKVSFNGVDAQLLYSSATQVAAIVPASITGASAAVAVSFQSGMSAPFTVPVAPSSPGIFTLDQTGSGQATAINADGSVNTAANPAKAGGSISFFATGEGQSSANGQTLPVSVTIGGIPATVQSASETGQAAGVMRVTVQVPNGVPPGGYVPVVLKVGDASNVDGAVWIAVSGL